MQQKRSRISTPAWSPVMGCAMRMRLKLPGPCLWQTPVDCSGFNSLPWPLINGNEGLASTVALQHCVRHQRPGVSDPPKQDQIHQSFCGLATSTESFDGLSPCWTALHAFAVLRYWDSITSCAGEQELHDHVFFPGFPCCLKNSDTMKRLGHTCSFGHQLPFADHAFWQVHWSG